MLISFCYQTKLMVICFYLVIPLHPLQFVTKEIHSYFIL